MIVEPRRRKSSSVTFSVPDDHYNQQYYPQRTFSFAESEWDYEPTISTISPTAVVMARALRSIKTLKKSWDSDKALTSTFKGKFGTYQLRAYILLAIGYAIIGSWLLHMPTFALLPPKTIDCTPIYPNDTNATYETTTQRVTTASVRLINDTKRRDPAANLIRRVEPHYNYSTEYGRSVLTDFNALCNTARLKLPHLVYIIGLILGGLIFGYIADHHGRKMVLLGSMWTACVLSIFQLLSDDYISYVFFIFFVGMAIGSVQVITVPYVIEMYPIESRAIYGLSLMAGVFLLDLVLPWFAMLIKNWKILQAVVTIPLIFTAALYWLTEESMFWFTAQKDYVSAVLSLSRIAQFNGIVFQDVFREANDFLRGKRSKAIQCDFQPLLRLEDIQSLGTKYPDFDMVDLQATTNKKRSCSQRALEVITGHHYYPTLSTFYPTDFFHSAILTIYLLVMCGLWLVSSLTEYGLDSPHLTIHLTDNYFLNYFFKQLVQIASFLVAFPMVYKWGRRWPTFCFFLIAEVCLLGSVVGKLDNQHVRTVMLVIYFTGKFAARGAFIVILLYTSEIFPTGLRCTTLGICYMFRLIGVALASEQAAQLNDWMPRLIYGIMSLVLGAMALLLPETKKFPLPRTIVQVEVIPTSVSKKFRRHRSVLVKRSVRPDGTRPEGTGGINDGASSVSGPRSVRFGPYDNQSTLHSVYELQEYGPDDTVQSSASRSGRRMDLRNPSLFQPSHYPHGGVTGDSYRQQPIAEDGEYDEDVDDDRTRYAQQQRRTGQQSPGQNIISRASDDVIVVPNAAAAAATKNRKPSSSGSSTQLEMTAQIQAGDVAGDRSAPVATIAPSTTDESTENKQHEKPLLPQPPPASVEEPAYRSNLNEEENYFSEHC